MPSQIEFANIILINKCDMVSPGTVERIRNLVSQLNPAAHLETTVRSAIDPRHLLDTRTFEFDKAATSAGWLQSLKEVKNPETIEYGGAYL
jgi:G3E family GTPase